MSVLIFVEDPGAANFVRELPAALEARGVGVELISAQAATSYLSERGVESTPADGSAADLLDRCDPELVVVGTSENVDTLGLALVVEARARSIPSIGVVDALANAAFRFRGRGGDPLAYCPDQILVPDRWTAETFAGLGLPADRIIVSGHPHYDLVLREKAKLEKRDREAERLRLFGASDRPVVLFVSEISTGLDAAQFSRSAAYTLAGRGGSDARSAIVLEELIDGLRMAWPEARLYLRLHPKEAPEDLGSLVNEVAGISRAGSPLEIVFAADLVVGMTTMLLLEAALLGRPTLSIVPRALEREWLPSLRDGSTPCATSREELVTELRKAKEGGGTPVSPPGVLENSLERMVCLIRDRLAERVAP